MSVLPPPIAAVDLYGRALAAVETLDPVLRNESGVSRTLPVRRWLAPVDAADATVLDRARGPVLDVGCGPGRHVHALAARGCMALGIDACAVAVEVARGRGARVLERDVFDRVPGAGSWRTVLLLDGSIGIGGRPPALLTRVAVLLARNGQVLVEAGGEGTTWRREEVRLELGPERSEWFAWASVPLAGVSALAAAAGLSLVETWSAGDRCFARLERS